MEIFSLVKVSEHLYPRILKPGVRLSTVTHALDIKKKSCCLLMVLLKVPSILNQRIDHCWTFIMYRMNEEPFKFLEIKRKKAAECTNSILCQEKRLIITSKLK